MPPLDVSLIFVVTAASLAAYLLWLLDAAPLLRVAGDEAAGRVPTSGRQRCEPTSGRRWSRPLGTWALW